MNSRRPERQAMAKITYLEANGREHVVDVCAGLTVMEGARSHGVPGILADCGGNCACGTCRVYIDEPWLAKAGEASEVEAATIEAQEDAGPGKRLSCQIKVADELDGLVVRMPETQC